MNEENTPARRAYGSERFAEPPGICNFCDLAQVSFSTLCYIALLFIVMIFAFSREEPVFFLVVRDPISLESCIDHCLQE